MSAVPQTTIQERARQALRQVLELVLREGRPAVVVDSPPGAGKTYLIESVVATAVQHARLRVAVVAPRAEQTYDFLRRLTKNFGPMPIQVLKSASRALPDDLAQSPRIRRVATKPAELEVGPGVVVGTADKLVFGSDKFDEPFDLLICDEAYQVMYQTMAPLFQIGRQTLLVGDPGQLPPLVQVDTARFDAAPHKVHWATPRELLRRFPDAPTVKLPASRRLPQDTVDLVQPAFYPSLPFASAAASDERRLRLARGPRGDAIDRALDMLAMGATLAGILLPATDLPLADLDEGVAEVMAQVAQRLLERHAEWAGQRRLMARDLGCIDPHVASGAAVRRQLRKRGISADELMVDTPEIWQGLERPIMVVKHTLSGLPRLSSFSLEPGRWCVMLSRHQLGCVIVGREGIGAALERHRHNCADRPMGVDNAEWAGWRAHVALWGSMERMGRIVRA